jgi:hypothetical protein
LETIKEAATTVSSSEISLYWMVMIMRMSSKGFQVNSVDNQLFGVDFHDFIQQEANSTTYELASEFGLTLGDVKKLKKRMERS